MEREKNQVLVQECFYLRSSLDWMAEKEWRIDKCLFVVVERGRGVLLLGEEEHEVNRRRVLFLRPELRMRKLRSSADFSVSIAGFPPYMLRDCAQRLEPRFMLLLFSKMVWNVEERVRKLARHFIELFRFAVVGYGRGFTRELVLSLTGGLVFGFYELAGAVQLNESAVESSRSRELFRNFMDLLHLLQEAMKRLDKNDSSIQEISVGLGFPDQSYFGRFFKRMKQMSPQQYRLRSKR